MSRKYKIQGIGGFFFRSQDPSSLSIWYEEHFEINAPSLNLKKPMWIQLKGPTVFGPTTVNTNYFGSDSSKQWMINFRVDNISEFIKYLDSKNIAVSHIEEHPKGLFAKLFDPEGNPIEIWQPTKKLQND